MAILLDQIIPWGRSRHEYDLMFRLAFEDLSAGVLDCGGGPASFTAELSVSGIRAISVDPVYVFSGLEIQGRFEAVVEPMLSQIRATPGDWTWTYHRDPDDLCANRRVALRRFLADYDEGLRQHRYIVGELPSLPFDSGSFGLAVCSHLLFLYSDLLSEAFHIRSAQELCRVAREVRFFPLLTLRGEPSPHLAAVRSALDSKGWASEVVLVNYELQRGGNQMLRVFRT
jgi:SAM-dependent methyltransferase